MTRKKESPPKPPKNLAENKEYWGAMQDKMEPGFSSFRSNFDDFRMITPEDIRKEVRRK